MFFFFSADTVVFSAAAGMRKFKFFLTCLWLCINAARSQIISQNCLANTEHHFASPSNEAAWLITVQVVWEPLPDLAALRFVRVVMICVIQPLTGISLSLSAADSYAVYSHVIPLDSCRVCTQQHCPAGREDSIDASRCTNLKFFWALPRSVNNMSRNKDGSPFLGFCFIMTSPCTAQISHALQIESMKAIQYIYLW